MRSVRSDEARHASGEAVWSWRPDAGVKLSGSDPEAKVARKPVTWESAE